MIPFLDCLVSRNDNKLQTTIYRKPTNTDRLLDQSSYNLTSHKATTIRAQLVCDSPDSLTDETKYFYNVFSKNNYNPDFVQRNFYKNNEPNTTNAKTKTTNLTRRTQNLSLQRQYLTSKALLRLLYQSYNLTTAVSLQNRSLPYDNF